MVFPSRQAAIVGVYTTEQKRNLDRTSFSLSLEAMKGALADAGLTIDDVGGLVPMGVPLGGAPTPDRTEQFWAAQLGGRTLTFTHMGAPTSGVHRAVLGIAAGMCDVVVVFWGKAGWQVGPGGRPVPQSAPRAPGEFHYDIFGAGMVPFYALWAQRYMHEFGSTSEDLAEVAVIHRDHAVLNPASLMGSRGKLTVDDVMNSRMISSPLHLYDCSVDNDGGYALVVASAAVARSCAKRPVWVIGGAEAFHTDGYTTFDAPWFPPEGRSVRRAGDMAFSQAGVTRQDIDVAGLYDCFTITMLRDLEELGFCGIGDGAQYMKEGHTRLGGSMPCNTDGGLLSNSHVGLPHGLFTIEVVRQLRGECGDRQVAGATIGLSLSQGASVHGYAGTLIMATD
jgi:acetyl-CoA acetyltransferase